MPPFVLPFRVPVHGTAKQPVQIQRGFAVKKIYIYAFDRRTENLTAALSCPDKWTAFKVLQEAGNSLEINGHGGSLIFDYDVSEGKIEYKPYIRKSWFSKQSEDCYKKIEFDADDFTITELQTKKSISEVRGHYRHEIRHDVWFMYYANLELQKLANAVRPAKAVESLKSVACPTDSPFQIQAANGNYAPEIVIDGNLTAIGDTTGKPLHVRDDSVIEVVKEHVEATREQTELLKKIYLGDESKFLAQKDYPDETKGFWEPQKRFAIRMALTENTLKRYREKNNGVKWSEDKTWGKDKVGNIFKKENDRPNLPYARFSLCHKSASRSGYTAEPSAKSRWTFWQMTMIGTWTKL